ncbi:MAG: SRPBCC family protein [Rubrobacteraceae bacterium]
MINLTRSEPINCPDEERLTRTQVWEGLVLKGLDGTPFVKDMTSCRVLERTENEIVREIVLRGETFQERVTLQPESKGRTYRLSGPVMGVLENVIEEDEDGGLHLRFNYELQLEGVKAGSAEEEEFRRKIEADLDSVRATIDKIRELAASGEIAAPATR